MTNEELAEVFGVPLDTLLAYRAPERAKKFRQMAEVDTLVLARILSEQKRR